MSIANVSRRGLMLRAPSLPGRGTFVEVRHRTVCIIGRVVWSSGSSCGVRTQEVVDADALVSSAPARAGGAERERRAVPRQDKTAPPPHLLVQRAERSKLFGQIFQWLVVALVGALAAVMIAQMAGAALGTPLRQAQAAMEQARP